MPRLIWPAAVVLAALAVPVYAQEEQARPPRLTNDPPPLNILDPQAIETAGPQPLKLAEQPPSVYDLPTPPGEKEAINYGGIHLDIKVTYFSNYVYRGVNRSDFIAAATGRPATDRANFQFDGKLMFDLGKWPHPFIGIFTNVLDSDPVSNFQEVRPFFGFDWKIRPLIILVGDTLYEFPERKEINTSELWMKVTLDDMTLLKRDEPLLSPYLYTAYDYDRYEGWYFEAGISHDFVIEKTGITLTPVADVAYVLNHGEFKLTPNGSSTGFQHYDIGLIGKYSLNNLLNIPQRFGNWSVNGYVYYTAGIDGELRAENTVWGGVGIQLTY